MKLFVASPLKVTPPCEQEIQKWVKSKLDTKRRDKLQKKLEKKYPEAKKGYVVLL